MRTLAPGSAARVPWPLPRGLGVPKALCHAIRAVFATLRAGFQFERMRGDRFSLTGEARGSTLDPSPTAHALWGNVPCPKSEKAGTHDFDLGSRRRPKNRGTGNNDERGK